MRHRLPLAPLGVAVALALSPARAETPSDMAERALNAIAKDLTALARGIDKPPISTLRSQAKMRFQSLDLDANGFSQADLDLAMQTGNARVRSRIMIQWLARDLNWDGKVTREELRASLMQQARRPLGAAAGQVAPTEEQVETALAQLIDKTGLPDPDGDGVTTLAEMRAGARDVETHRTRRRIREPDQFADHSFGAVFDADGDGTTTLAEFEQVLDTALAVIDADGDGTLSKAEAADLNARRSRHARQSAEARHAALLAREQETRAKGCTIPQVAGSTHFVLATVGAGTALPTVSLGGDDLVTTLVRMRVERGTKPITLLVASDTAVILDVDGAVERLASVTGIGGPLGVRGVAPGRVHLTDPERCALRPRHLARRGESRSALDLIAGLAGRKPNAVVTTGRVGQIAIPSGKERRSARFDTEIDFARGSDAGPLWERFRARVPGGLVSVDPASVISRETPRRYGILPYEAGLARMIETGQLALLDPGRMDERLQRTETGGVRFGNVTVSGGRGQDVLVIGDRVFRQDGSGGWRGGAIPTLRVLGKVTLPAGTGPSTAIFVLPADVPEPRTAGGRDASHLRVDRER